MWSGKRAIARAAFFAVRHGQLAAIDQGNDNEVEHQPQGGHGHQAGGKPQVRDAGMRTDVDVLRVAGDRSRRADVCRRCQGDQVRNGVESQSPGQVEHQGRQGEAHDVVDEES